MAKTKHEEVFRVLLREKLNKGNRAVLIKAVVLDELAETPWRKSFQHVVSSLKCRYGPCFTREEVREALDRLVDSNSQVEFTHGRYEYFPRPIEILADVRWRVNQLSLQSSAFLFRRSIKRFCPKSGWAVALKNFVDAL